MKKIFALLFSFQLILSPVVYAQSQDVGLKDAYLETGTGSQGGYDFYTNQVLVLATSAIGSSIITQCLEGLKTPSIATYMAGSLVHIMSEIAGAKSKNERHKKKMKDLEIEEDKLKKEGDSSQKAVLEQSLQEEKDTRDFLANRKNWMIAVTAIYTAAMGAAIIEEIYGQTAGGSAGSAACTASGSKCLVAAAACGAACAGGVAGIIAKTEATTSLPNSRETANAFCTTVAVSAPEGCLAWANSYLGLVYGACIPQATDGGASFLSWNTLLTMAYGFGSSKLGAGGGSISQYGTMLIGLLSMLVPSLSKAVVQAYSFPIPRSITFGASAALTGVVTSGLAKREKIAEENIKKLEKVISEFKIQTAGDNLGLDTDKSDYNQKDPNGNESKKYDLKKLQAVNTPKSCFSKSGSQWSHSEKSCANSYKVPKANLKGVSFPAISSVAGLSADMAQAVADGDMGKAGKISGEIGAYAARVKEETKKLQAAYNDMRKKEKKSTKDFDADVKKQVASLQAELNKAAASKNMNLAKLGEPLPADDKKTDDSIKASKVTTEDSGTAPAVDPLAGIGSSEETPVEATTATDSNPEQNLSDFETNEQDISKKNDVSLFKQLSNRYILNYTKIFERKKDPEVNQEPPKK